MKKIFATLLVFVLVGCQENSGISAQNRNAASPDKVAYEIYSELMNQILSQNLGSVSTGTSYRAGQGNPYRKGFPGYSHKALAACMVWDAEKADASYKSWNSSGTNDWGYTTVRAIDDCEQKKRQQSWNCKCQVIDHDDLNVLEVPHDFRRAYERAKSQRVAAGTSDKNFYLYVKWENVVPDGGIYPVSVKQSGASGYVEPATIGGKEKCGVFFNFTSADKGDWNLTCTDGTKGMGLVQGHGAGQGSSGEGVDSNLNKIEFRLTRIQ